MNFQSIQTLFASTENIKKIKEDIASFIKNPENPWEQREWVWENCPEAFMKQGYSYMDYSFTDGEEVSWFDDFYTERHEVVVCRDLSDRGRFGEEPEEWEAFKKHCINEGILSFEFDW
jgi:hypothetical protein